MDNNRDGRIHWTWVLMLAAGCAATSPRSAPSAARLTAAIAKAPAPATEPSDPRANLSLEQLQPPLALATSHPSMQGSSAPPLEAVRLFAKARIAQLDGKRLAADQLLEEAVGLDPESFELHRSLGDLDAEVGDAQASAQWEKAEALEPDHLALQISLARHALDEDKPSQAIAHLRLALLTTDYRRGDPAAGEADFFLARTLEKQGYDRAALQLYERLLSRLDHPGFSSGSNQQMAALLAHPDVLAVHVAALYEKQKNFASAARLLGIVAGRVPDDFDVRARLARDTAAAGRESQAIQQAADLTMAFHADERSVALLRDLAGDKAAMILRRLQRENPSDRDLVYALSDVLLADSRPADAGKVLADATLRWPDDLRLLGRGVAVLRVLGNHRGAARQLINFLAAHPDHELELAPMWDSLGEPSPQGSLHASDVATMRVARGTQAARFFWLARSADAERRDGLASAALLAAVAVRPAFAPAWRDRLGTIWVDSSETAAQKIAASDQLAKQADDAGDAALAAELRGMTFLNRDQARQAAGAFAGAVKAGDRSAELCLNFAVALHGIGDDQGAQSLLWRVISDRPLAPDAFVELTALYEKRQEPDKAARVLAVWKASDPDGISANLAAAQDAFVRKSFTEARKILLNLETHNGANARVLDAMSQFDDQTAQSGALIDAWRQRLAAQPWNSTLAIALAQAYQRQHQLPQAIAVLDHLRATQKDPALLYTIAGLYARLGDDARSEQALSAVVKLDPAYAGAENDLGYVWAEQGKHLNDAEALVRRALKAEPDNLSFLDSMGWVLYKRGKFDEAKKSLTRAALLADPIVLDHLGDTLYQLGDRAAAAAQWRAAAGRLGDLSGDDRRDLTELRGKLLRKQGEADAGKSVSVAPVGEGK